MLCNLGGWNRLRKGEGVVLEDNADVVQPGWLELLVEREREGLMMFWLSPACARLPTNINNKLPPVCGNYIITPLAYTTS